MSEASQRPTPAPGRPSARQEWLCSRLFRWLAPRIVGGESPSPPRTLAPFESLELPREHGEGTLGATWFPAEGRPQGAVLLLHPWLVWGRSYFHRRGRVPALRRAGFHVLTVDLPGFCDSGPPGWGFLDRDVEEALDHLLERVDGLPVHVWGVSSGGYWAHPVLARRGEVESAFFEDVSPHLIEWSRRSAPLGLPFYAFFRRVTRASYRYLDMRRHAPWLRVRRVAYVSGALDRGVLPADTEALARAARGRWRIVPDVGHLEAIKRDGRQVIQDALEVFAPTSRMRLAAPQDPASLSSASPAPSSAATAARM